MKFRTYALMTVSACVIYTYFCLNDLEYIVLEDFSTWRVAVFLLLMPKRPHPQLRALHSKTLLIVLKHFRISSSIDRCTMHAFFSIIWTPPTVLYSPHRDKRNNPRAVLLGTMSFSLFYIFPAFLTNDQFLPFFSC
jgi:hypothetical protein